MNLSKYIDATYLTTSEQAGISEAATQNQINNLVNEAITFQCKSVMIRAEYIPIAKALLKVSKSNVLVGTVIAFPHGDSTIKEKLAEMTEAINLGADELDVVINYQAFKNGEVALIIDELISCTYLALGHAKTIKWIIEVAALTDEQIKGICKLIKREITIEFGSFNTDRVFVKSSTGFYKTEDGAPNGATLKSIRLMSKYVKPLKIKAAGGIKTRATVLKMITLGVDRIGSSAAKAILTEEQKQ